MPDTTFFESGKTYCRDELARVSEVLRIFRCVAVAAHPNNGQPQAFGFVRYAHGFEWQGAVWSSAHWGHGWVESDAHSCGNCLGVDPETCLYNGEKES